MTRSSSAIVFARFITPVLQSAASCKRGDRERQCHSSLAGVPCRFQNSQPQFSMSNCTRENGIDRAVFHSPAAHTRPTLGYADDVKSPRLGISEGRPCMGCRRMEYGAIDTILS